MRRLAFEPAVGSAHPSGDERGGLGGETESSVLGVRSSALEKKAALRLPRIDPVTDAHLNRLAQLLPEGAFHAAREEIARCRPRNPGAYAVALLNKWFREGRYAA